MKDEADPGIQAELELAEAREHLMELARILGRAAAKAAHMRGLHFDVDDPEIAKDLIRTTFDAVVLSRRAPR